MLFMDETGSTGYSPGTILGDSELLEMQRKASANAGSTEAGLLASLQERIKAGQSSGDPIKDFVILYYDANSKCEEKIRALESQLREYDGQLMVQVERYQKMIHDEPQGCFGGGPMYAQKADISFGRIQAPYLTIDSTGRKSENILEKISGSNAYYPQDVLLKEWDAEITVNPLIGLRAEWQPPQGHEHYLFRVNEMPSIHREKNIQIHLLNYFLNKSESGDIPDNPVFGGRKPRRIGGSNFVRDSWHLVGYNLCVGTQAVDAFFEKNNVYAHFMMDGLEKEINLGTGKEFYVNLRTLLLDEAALTSYLGERKRKDGKERQEQMQALVFELVQCNTEYITHAIKLKENMEHAPEAAKSIARILTLPGELTARRRAEADVADAQRIGRFHKRRELEELESKIRRYLTDAIGINMHKEKKTVELPCYPGVEINVASFITGLCEQYKVELPK